MDYCRFALSLLFAALSVNTAFAAQLQSHHYYTCSVEGATWMKFEKNLPTITNDRSPESSFVSIDFKEFDTHYEISVDSGGTGPIFWRQSSERFSKDVKYFAVTRSGNWFNYSSPARGAWNIHLSRVYKEDWLGFLTGGFKDSRYILGVECERTLYASDILDK